MQRRSSGLLATPLEIPCKLVTEHVRKLSSIERNGKVFIWRKLRNSILTYHEHENWIWWHLSVRNGVTSGWSWHLVSSFETAREPRELDRRHRGWTALAPSDGCTGLLTMALGLKGENFQMKTELEYKRVIIIFPSHEAWKCFSLHFHNNSHALSRKNPPRPELFSCVGWLVINFSPRIT